MHTPDDNAGLEQPQRVWEWPVWIMKPSYVEGSLALGGLAASADGAARPEEIVSRGVFVLFGLGEILFLVDNVFTSIVVPCTSIWR